uniref:Uncharacterized protein n=1 Tax=Arundo donax TaxID=35708 RepID=A0A0A9EV45_ARUDO
MADCAESHSEELPAGTTKLQPGGERRSDEQTGEDDESAQVANSAQFSLETFEEEYIVERAAAAIRSLPAPWPIRSPSRGRMGNTSAVQEKQPRTLQRILQAVRRQRLLQIQWQKDRGGRSL